MLFAFPKPINKLSYLLTDISRDFSPFSSDSLILENCFAFFYEYSTGSALSHSQARSNIEVRALLSKCVSLLIHSVCLAQCFPLDFVLEMATQNCVGISPQSLCWSANGTGKLIIGLTVGSKARRFENAASSRLEERGIQEVDTMRFRSSSDSFWISAIFFSGGSEGKESRSPVSSFILLLFHWREMGKLFSTMWCLKFSTYGLS